MKEKILVSLRTKFDGVSDSILARIADKLSKTVTTDEQVAPAVDGVTLQQLLESYGDSRATESAKTAVSNYEAKHSIKDGKPIDVSDPKPTQTEETPAWAQAILDANSKLKERLDRMDSEKTASARRSKLNEIVNRLPDSLRSGYARTPVETISDEAFDTLLSEITSEVDSLVRETSAKGSVFGRPTSSNGGGGEELSKEQLEAITHRDGAKDGSQPF